MIFFAFWARSFFERKKGLHQVLGLCAKTSVLLFVKLNSTHPEEHFVRKDFYSEKFCNFIILQTFRNFFGCCSQDSCLRVERSILAEVCFWKNLYIIDLFRNLCGKNSLFFSNSTSTCPEEHLSIFLKKSYEFMFFFAHWASIFQLVFSELISTCPKEHLGNFLKKNELFFQLSWSFQYWILRVPRKILSFCCWNSIFF